MIILSIPSPTSKELAKNLGIKRYRKHNCPANTDVLIRWGSLYSGITANKTYNTIEAINKACNKPLARKILAEAGVPVPQDIGELEGEDRFPCIGRPTKHSKGSGFHYCECENDITNARMEGCTYFSKFYPKKAEYRVHIGSGKILFISRKINGDENSYVWNHDKGFIFKVISQRFWRESVKTVSLRSLEALELDFGAVDVLVDGDGDNLPIAVVLEVNTAPSLTGYSLEKYTNYFKELLNEGLSD
jgi:hypothetical protein